MVRKQKLRGNKMIECFYCHKKQELRICNECITKLIGKEIFIEESCAFTHNQKVAITSGYYKGYYGKIKAYDEKTKVYQVELTIDDRTLRISCIEEQLRKIKSWLKFK